MRSSRRTRRNVAPRVGDVAQAREALEARGVEFDGEIRDTGVWLHGVLQRQRGEPAHAPPPVRAVKVETVDFPTIPTCDIERSVRWYTEVLGLEPGAEGEVETPNVTISFWSSERDGEELRPHVGGFGILRVADVEEARRSWRRRGSSSSARRSTPVSATWASSMTRTATRSSCTGGTPPVAREQLLERYRELPLPTTKDESWRFTDLRGFDPDTFTAEGAGSAPERLLDIGVSGLVTVTESELTIDRAPEGVIFERLDESQPAAARAGRLGGEVRSAQRGAVAERPAGRRAAGVVLEEPLYVKIANSVDDGSLFCGCSSSPRRGRGSR